MTDYRIDGTKILYHPERVAQWRAGKDSWETAKNIYPVYIEAAPVGACPHACTFCGVDYVIEAHRNSPSIPRLDPSNFGATLNVMGLCGVKSIMYAGEGEPLLHKDINFLVDMSRGAGLDVAFTTNGILLDRLEAIGDCTWVKVSINAGSVKTYAQVHRAPEKDWSRVWGHIRKAASQRGLCTLGVQCIVLPENLHEMRALATICLDAGVDYLVLKPYSQHRFSITRQYQGTNYEAMMAYLETVREFETESFKVILRTESMKAVNEPIPYHKCHATPYLWAYIMANGDVYSCAAYLLDKRFLLGNINEQDFKSIWEGEKRHANWELMQTLNISECRQACRMDRVNRYLDEFGKTPHVNFI